MSWRQGEREAQRADRCQETQGRDQGEEGQGKGLRSAARTPMPEPSKEAVSTKMRVKPE